MAVYVQRTRTELVWKSDIYAAGIRANPDLGYGAPTMTLEEEQAIVDEAHRQGVRVACTAHAGVAVWQSIEAGCNSLEPRQAEHRCGFCRAVPTRPTSINRIEELLPWNGPLPQIATN